MQDFSETFTRIGRRLDEAQRYLRIDEQRARQPQLESEMSRPDLWDDADKAREVQTELAAVNDDLSLFDGLGATLEDSEVLFELAKDEDDESHEAEIQAAVAGMESKLDELELRSLFTGEFDERDAVCQIKSGEGGTDAQDWAEMLLRMYSRWADGRGFDFEVMSASEGTEAGLSSVEFMVRGRHAYGLLQGEHGVHRLVRISPFNNEGKRQTAFSAMQVAPFFEAMADEIDIDEKELRIDTYRSSGAGGQHVNVTDSAVRITHLPTGTVTSCQNERSQHQNKDRAMQMLAAKLLDLERKKREDEIAAITGEQKNVGFGSQIRSYVLQPYQMVKDLRTEYETGNVDAVLGGALDDFMEAYLRFARAEGEKDQ
ncbi:MAG: peptide chain release factor 2 [Acidimicrobiales bacterium]|nr:peptide chain release factor 2 [Acidimicrobiales bacterium]RZV48663.1 MAG: peptide chain release factor 2 [Acidimicrobiales bacterium]